MTQEEKSLLLQDLCARLPYGVIVYDYDREETREMGFGTLHDIMFNDLECNPYLRPMSSITEEEKEELLNLLFDKEAKYFYIDEEGLIDGKASSLMKEGLNYPAFCPINVEIYTDYLNSHHFDWRTDSNGKTLIEKGLALEAPKDMYNN